MRNKVDTRSTFDTNWQKVVALGIPDLPPGYIWQTGIEYYTSNAKCLIVRIVQPRKYRRPKKLARVETPLLNMEMDIAEHVRMACHAAFSKFEMARVAKVQLNDWCGETR